MWRDLPKDQRDRYKKLITNFASLSEAFAQKADDSMEIQNPQIAPIVNSKYQETVFHHAFNAVVEDIGNSSFDASIVLDNQKQRFLVGIKSFGIGSGAQKIAQFKNAQGSNDWFSKNQLMKDNADRVEKELKALSEKVDNSELKRAINEVNHDLYMNMALEIANLRNARIDTSIAQLKGFDPNENINIEIVYHVLMPSEKKDSPAISVGETSYQKIDTKSIKILGVTTVKNPANFDFTDGNHTYRVTPVDSQLLMFFDNKNIVIETWQVDYVDNAVSFFEKMQPGLKSADKSNEVIDSVSWRLDDDKGNVKESSGFNMFDAAPKIGKKDKKKRIDKIIRRLNELNKPQEIIDWFTSNLNSLLLEGEKFNKTSRDKILERASNELNEELNGLLKSLLLRPEDEMYIPIPNSIKFHKENPEFFGRDFAQLMKLKANKRKFRAKFIPSGNEIDLYIVQSGGKAIESSKSQSFLGRWLLRDIFKLKPRELLTGQKMYEAGVNAVRFIKYKDETKPIGVELFWMDMDNIPNDAIGWVAKKKYSKIPSNNLKKS